MQQPRLTLTGSEGIDAFCLVFVVLGIATGAKEKGITTGIAIRTRDL